MENKRNYYVLTAFVFIFAALGLLALHIPLFQLAGSVTKFTVYDFFAPALTGFLGTVPGLLAILATQVVNAILTGHVHLDTITIVRFVTPLVAAFYFSRHRAFSLVIPVVAIILFSIHPVGRTVWFYSLYWLIPLAMYPLSNRWLPARALGATFTAHAVGGVAYLYFVHLPQAVWLSLIPVVATERIAFAAGITVTYVVLNNVLAYLATARFPKLERLIERRFVWKLR